MYAWEIPFQKLVGEKRANELVEVRKATRLRTVLLGFLLFTERTALFLTVLTYIFLGNPMSANVVSKPIQIITDGIATHKCLFMCFLYLSMFKQKTTKSSYEFNKIKIAIVCDFWLLQVSFSLYLIFALFH